VAQRRLRHVQALGCAAEVQILGDRHEVAQVTKFDHRQCDRTRSRLCRAVYIERV
jgi:hypothetical protein